MTARRFCFLLILSSLLVGAAGAVKAAEPEPGVARISLIHGDVTSKRGDSGDWVALTVNSPLVRGDTVATGTQSRTEIQLDYANTVRLGDRTEVKLADLTRTQLQVQVKEGVLNLTVLKGSEAEVEIDTPNVAIRPLKEGRYRVEVVGGETRVIVRKGEAEALTPQGSTIVKKGKMITVRGVDDPEYQIAGAADRDNWDRWNEDRDDAMQDARSWGYGSRYYTGLHDLDRYGRWVYVSGYDWVWSPYADPYWAPYRHGRWLWEPYWGWTWVSYEPWGWAPYHYGRWFCHGSAWYWWPGPVHAYYRPTWAPAYVSFFGFGFGRLHFSFGVGWGYHSLGWVPVGPWDYYHPWHGRHYNSYHAVNITNITNVTNIRNITNVRNAAAVPPLADRRRPYKSNLQGALSDERVRNGVTTLSTDDFVKGRSGREGRRPDSRELRDAQLVAGAVPAVPGRESLRPSQREVAQPRAEGNQRAARMFTRREPPSAGPAFSERADSIRRMVEGPERSSSEARSARSMRGTESRETAAGVDSAVGGRVGESSGSSPAPAGRASGRVARDRDEVRRVETARPSADGEGWRSFRRNGGEASRAPAVEERRSQVPSAGVDEGRRAARAEGGSSSVSTQPGNRDVRNSRTVRSEAGAQGPAPDRESGPSWRRFGRERESGNVRSETAVRPREDAGAVQAPRESVRPESRRESPEPESAPSRRERARPEPEPQPDALTQGRPTQPAAAAETATSGGRAGSWERFTRPASRGVNAPETRPDPAYSRSGVDDGSRGTRLQRNRDNSDSGIRQGPTVTERPRVFEAPAQSERPRTYETPSRPEASPRFERPRSFEPRGEGVRPSYDGGRPSGVMRETPRPSAPRFEAPARSQSRGPSFSAPPPSRGGQGGRPTARERRR